MSATIDERVVQMKFDNKNFEDNVKVSMGTLDKLKAALNFNNAKESVKTLNEATKSVDFSKMADSIDTISDRFSALGIVGMTVLQNLTNKAIDSATEILGKVPSMIIQGGWKRAMDVEQGRFTLQGLIDDQQKVNDLMEAARNSVKDTAYASNEAIKAASVFAASGIQDAEEMYYVLKGVAGVTATANADYESIARIFQTISGQGRVMGEQLNQLANRGLNAAAVMANYYDVTETEIREMVSAGEVSFEMFSEAMTETFGEHAYDANKTFTGAMANIRAALARTGEAFFHSIIEQESPAVDTFNAIRESINKMNGVLTPVLEEAAMSVNVLIQAFADFIRDVPVESLTRIFVNLFKIIGNVLSPLGDTIWAIGSAMRENFDLSIIADTLADFTDNLVNLTSTFSLSESVIKAISTLFGGLFDVISMVGEGIFNFFKMLIGIESPVERVTGGISGFMSAIGNGLSNFVETVRQSENLKKAFEGISDTIKKFRTSVGTVFNKIGEAFDIIFKNAGNAATTVGGFIGLLASKAVSLFLEALTKIASVLTKLNELFIIPALTWFVDNLKEAAKIVKKFFGNIRENVSVRTALKKISDAFDKVYEATKKAFEPLQKIFERLSTNIKNASNSFGEFVGNLAIDVFETFVDILSKIVDFLAKIAESFVIPAIGVFVENISNATTKLKEFGEEHSFIDVLDKIKEKIDAVKEGFKQFFDELLNNGGTISNVAGSIKEMWDNFKLLQGGASAQTLYDDTDLDNIENVSEELSIVDKASIILKNFGQRAKNAFDTAHESLNNFINAVIETDPQTITDNIRNSLNKLKDALIDLINRFSSWKDTIVKIVDKIKDAFSDAAKAIGDFFKTMDVNKLIAVIFTGVMIALLVALFRLVNIFSTLTLAVSNAFKSVKTFLVSFKKSGNDKTMMERVAESIVLIAGALIALSFVDSDKLGKVTLLLAGISAALLAFTFVMTVTAALVKGLKLEEPLEALSKSLVAISASIIILVAAVKILESVDFLKAQKTVIVILELGLILVALAKLMASLSILGPKDLFTMLGFAITIDRFAKLMQGIATVDFKNIQDNLYGVIAVFAGLSLLAFAASNMKLTSALGLLAFVYVLEKVMPIINSLEFPDVSKYMKLIHENIDFLVSIGLLISGMIIVAALFGKGFSQFGAGMLMLAASLVVTAYAINILATIDSNKLSHGAGVIAGILMLFGLLSLILSRGYGGDHATKVALAIGAMVLSLYPLAGAVYILGTMSGDKVAQGIAAVSMIMGMFALITYAANTGNGSTKIGVVLTMTFGIVALMGELIALTFIPYEQVLAAAGGMSLVLFGIASVFYAVGKIETVPKKTILLLLELIGLIAALAVALKYLANEPWEGMLGASASLSLVLLSLAKSMDIISEIDWTKALGQATSLIYLAVALIPLGYALTIMSNNDWQGMVGAAVGLSLTVLALGTTIKMMDGVDWKTAIGNATACVMLAVALIPIGYALRLLSEEPWQGMLGAAISLGIVIIALGTAVRIMGDVDWKSALSGAVACVAFSLVLGLVAEAIKSLTNEPLDGMIVASAAMSLVILALGAAVNIMGDVDWKSALSGAVACVAFSLVLGFVAEAIKTLANEPLGGMLLAAISIGLVVLALGATVKIMDGVDWKSALSGAAACVILSITLSAVADAIKWLANEPLDGMIAAAVAISLVVLALGATVKIINEVDWLGAIAGAAACVILSITLSSVADAIKLIASEPWEGILAAAAAIGLVILALGACVQIIDSVDWIGAIVGAAACLLLSIALIPIAEAIKKIAVFDFNNLLGAALAISTVLLALSGVTAILGLLGASGIAIPALIGAAALVGVIAILTAGFMALGALVAWIADKGRGEYIMKGLDFMVQIAGKLGDAIGAFVGGVIGGAGMKILEDIAAGLTIFSEKADPFVQWMNTIDDNIVGHAKALAGAILIFGATEFMDGIASLLGMSGLSGISDKLEEMAKGLQTFVDYTADMNVGNAEKAIDLATKLFALHPPNEGGWLADIIGDNTFDKFNAERLGENGLGGGIKGFADAVNGITNYDVSGGISVLESIFAIKMTRNATFADTLGSFNKEKLGSDGLGGGIKGFADAVDGVQYFNTAGGIKVANELFKLKPPNSGGWLADVVGDNQFENFNMSTLGAPGLGGGIRAFAACVKDVDVEASKNGITVAKELFKLHPPNEGGWIADLLGDNTFDKFNAERLGKDGLGGGIKAFIEQVKDFDNSAVSGAYYSAKALAILMDIDIPDNKMGVFEFVDRLQGHTGFEKFYETLEGLGGGIKVYYESIKDVDADTVKIVTDAIKNIAILLKNMSVFKTENIAKFKQAMAKAGDAGVKAFAKALKNPTEDFNRAFDTFMNKVVRALNDNKSTVLNAMSSFGDETVSVYDSKISNYNTTGSNSSLSYTEGFMSNQNLANASMEDFANGNIDALMGSNGFDFTGDYSNVLGGIGENGALSLTDGLLSMQGDTNLSFENFAQGGIGALTGVNGFDITGGQSNVMSGIGDTLTGSLSDSLSSSYNLGNIESSMKTITDKINNATANGISAQNMEDHMKNFASGAGMGVDKWGYLAENAASKLADKIKARFQQDMDEHSPSRVFMQFGKYLDEGLAIGIMDSASAPVEAIGDVSSSIYDSMRDAMSNSQNYISEDLDINPVITPMVDITGAMSEIQALNSMFDDTMLALNMQARFNEMDSDGFGEIDATNSDVVSSIDGLRADLSDLKAVVGNLQVVMDSGTLVGAIVPNMDMALGQRANLKRRGV